VVSRSIYTVEKSAATLCRNNGTDDLPGDIGGVDRWVWMIIGNLLALAAVCPFVGSLSDLIGRRWVAIVGSVLIIIGMIVVSTAHSMNVIIGKICNRQQDLLWLTLLQAAWLLRVLVLESANLRLLLEPLRWCRQLNVALMLVAWS